MVSCKAATIAVIKCCRAKKEGKLVAQIASCENLVSSLPIQHNRTLVHLLNTKVVTVLTVHVQVRYLISDIIEELDTWLECVGRSHPSFHKISHRNIYTV